jgi:pimeloyl-ACP methyl ester carboxylesterase
MSSVVPLYFVESGLGTVPVVFLHGLGSSSEDWQLQIPTFAAQYRVLACDLRGHGQSPKPRSSYKIPILAQDVLAWLDSLDVRVCHLVGLSLGGMVAAEIASHHPHRIQSLVICNSIANFQSRSWHLRKQYLQRLLLSHLFPLKTSAQVLGWRLFPKPEQAELRKMLQEKWQLNHRPSYLAVLRGLYGWSTLANLQYATCPTLILHAEHDYFPLEMKQAMLNVLPNARLQVLPGLHHAAPIEAPEIFNQVVLDFVQENAGAFSTRLETAVFP